MSDYQFVTVWNIDAAVERVWDAIEDVDVWPEWWKGVLSVTEIEKGGETGVGSIRRTVWRSALPYRIEFDSEVVRIEKHKLIEARAFGELDGLGLWQFESVTSDRTRIQYDWHVKTTKAWMNLLAPVARPFFRWNHDTIMRWGEEGLKSRLGV
ncbi:MAG: SRPBCC family protein [Pyrinomonadaceae bacterium]|nr:SRPBCC family protein [Pyrinomonadaceae bacterium]